MLTFRFCTLPVSCRLVITSIVTSAFALILTLTIGTALAVKADPSAVQLSSPITEPRVSSLLLPQVITTVQFAPGMGVGPKAIGVNPISGYTYVANEFSDNVTVVSGTQVMAVLAAGTSPNAIGVNQATGYVYVANAMSNDVTVLSGTQVITTLAVGWNPSDVGVNPSTGYVYVVNEGITDQVRRKPCWLLHLK